MAGIAQKKIPDIKTRDYYYFMTIRLLKYKPDWQIILN